MNELDLIKLNIFEAYDNGEITYGEKEYLLEQVDYAYEDALKDVINGKRKGMRGSLQKLGTLGSAEDEYPQYKGWAKAAAELKKRGIDITPSDIAKQQADIRNNAASGNRSMRRAAASLDPQKMANAQASIESQVRKQFGDKRKVDYDFNKRGANRAYGAAAALSKEHPLKSSAALHSKKQSDQIKNAFNESVFESLLNDIDYLYNS